MGGVVVNTVQMNLIVACITVHVLSLYLYEEYSAYNTCMHACN